ncbi:hypothetical protein LXA43DRAFT_1007004 [Ganoderma leucocontextum]|nr:hypothetical protein LXA43DRAFT_1007004 [Ganoderma leucocontextum]
MSNSPNPMESAPPLVLSLFECLPVELLVDIFFQSRPTPKTSTDKGPFDDTVAECQRPAPNWALLMLVCHRFREVIVATSSMWFLVPVTKNLSELRLRLKRSGEHPIDLLLEGSCDGTLSLILPHAFRIRSIATAPDFSPHYLRSLVPLFKVALPALQEVYIPPKVNAYGQDRSWLIGANLALNEILHPRVKRLSSDRDILPPPDSAFWSLQLVHLDLRFQDVTMERPNDILQLLKGTRLLESLAITFPHTLPEDDEFTLFFGLAQFVAAEDQQPTVNNRHTPTPLARLRTFKLSSPIKFCKAVLHAFDMPSLDKLYINTTPGLMNPDGTIVDMFPDRLRRLLAQHTRLHIHAAPDGGGFRLGDCLCDTGRVSSDRFYLRVQGFRWSVVLPSPLGVLRRVFADARLEHLEVSYFVRDAAAESSGPWCEVLQTFDGLRRVTLRGNDKRSGRAMVNDIRALQGEGLNPDMVLVDENIDW